MHIGDPLAGLAAVVSVKHGGHGVHAQSVHAKPFQPVQAIANQKIAHFGATQVVDEGAPVVVETLARVSVFVKVRAVKIAQAMRVGREMGRHPIQQQADAFSMATGHKPGKPCCIPVTRGGCIQPHRLVTPGAIKRVFADGQQFQVREAHVLGIGNQRLGQFIPIQPAAGPAIHIVGNAAPGTQMHLVNAHGGIQRIGTLAHGGRRDHRRHGGDHTGRGGPQLGLARIGVGTGGQNLPFARANFELVQRPFRHTRQKQFPYTTFASQTHGMAASVPVIEIPHDADPGRVRRPYSEARARHAFAFCRHGTQHFIGTQVSALTQQPDIQIAQGWRKAVGVVHDHLAAIGPANMEPIARVKCSCEHALKKTILVPFGQGGQHPAGNSINHEHLLRVGHEGAYRHTSICPSMRPQHRERVVMACQTNPLDVLLIQHGV